jgi:hypothetical protein
MRKHAKAWFHGYNIWWAKSQNKEKSMGATNQAFMAHKLTGLLPI